MQQLEQADATERQTTWYGDLVSQMGREVGQTLPALEPLRGELLGLLDIVPMSGTPPTAALLAAGDINLPGTPPQGVVPQSQAVGYLMHSPRGLPGLPSMGIKIWPICKDESMWIVRAPTLSRPGETEQVPAFLLEPVYKLCGPFAAYRRATVDQARNVVAETGRVFVAFAEQYVAALADHQDPGAASTWEGRPLVAVDVQQGSTADRGDADLTGAHSSVHLL